MIMMIEIIGIMTPDARIDFNPEIDPLAQQIAIMRDRMAGIVKTAVALMVTTARTEIADPAFGAGQARAIHAFAEELVQARVIDALRDVAKARQVAPGKPVTEIDPATLIHRQHPRTRPAGQQLARPLVQVVE
jgi:hypothetical protein